MIRSTSTTPPDSNGQQCSLFICIDWHPRFQFLRFYFLCTDGFLFTTRPPMSPGCPRRGHIIGKPWMCMRSRYTLTILVPLLKYSLATSPPNSDKNHHLGLEHQEPCRAAKGSSCAITRATPTGALALYSKRTKRGSLCYHRTFSLDCSFYI